ncbi:MAG: SDR family NAD(P)-dependent oxidoreductase, partial [Burkholderiaceae bacterium]
MKTLVILTGHSRGLGAALTDELLGLGCSVIGLSRKSLVPKGAAKPGCFFDQVAIDLADSEALGRLLADDCLSKPIRDADRAILINNAGLLNPVGLVGEQSPTEIAQSVSVNVTAVLMLTNWFAKVSQKTADRRLVQ